MISIEIPPLRERPEEILPLCHRFVEKYRAKYKSLVKQVPEELERAFTRYSWPGNVRQLENAVRRFLILPDAYQTLAELTVLESRQDVSLAASLSLKEVSALAVEKAEKELILRTLDEVNWNRKEASRRLKICYKALLNKLGKWRWDRQHDSEGPDESGEDAFVASAN